ncbi:MAG: bifunctional transaldolase/phosoglucose isomerase [Candidatus Bipolaricaulia bacterium]
MNPLNELAHRGQSIWLDYIRRSLMDSGELARLVNEDSLTGLTSNPAIFQKAIAGSEEYDAQIDQAIRDDPHISTESLFWQLAIADIQLAADVLRPVYDDTNRADGYVSLEVSPQLADDTDGTLAEARRLWQAVDRPNLMIKVPATEAGIPAIETLIGEGINVNVTLMFSLDHYEAVANAYIKGLDKLDDPSTVASVASFFVSRVDAKIDPTLGEIGTDKAEGLKGRIAVANAKLAYRRYGEIFHGEPFAELREAGAMPQRVLWASTSTKNPDYRETIYVEELIGSGTVNTMPPATLGAFRDHGEVRGDTLSEDVEAAERHIQQLGELDIDLDRITEDLQREGVDKFVKPFEELLAALDEKRHDLQAKRVNPLSLQVGDADRQRMDSRLSTWDDQTFAQRLWRKDPTLWADEDTPEITDRLGWLDLPEAMHEALARLESLADDVHNEGFQSVILLGMGGSSLAPEVFQRVFGNAAGYPELRVLDSTHPDAVRRVDNEVDLTKTLFVVASKSGTTTESLSFFHYFWAAVSDISDRPGDHFVAITDPGTPLVDLASDRDFRATFKAPADVGGRYAALTPFGLVPAALIGMDVHKLLDRAWTLAEACAFCVPASENSALTLGAALGELAASGRDKLTLETSPSLVAFPDWLEQLIAESTGKDETGIVPVVCEPLGPPEVYTDDRVFVHLKLADEEDAVQEQRLADLEQAGHPVVRVELPERYDLSQEMFRWEMAIAAAGAVLNIHPFNQPNVELAKKLSKEAMGRDESDAQEDGIEALEAASAASVAARLQQWLDDTTDGDYIAIQAFIAPTSRVNETLHELRLKLRDRTQRATTLGYGPRFLHSTGQLHKGGPNTGLFLQLVDEPSSALPVPETDYSFQKLLRAQADGDYHALAQQNRRVIRINLGQDPLDHLEQLREALG